MYFCLFGLFEASDFKNVRVSLEYNFIRFIHLIFDTMKVESTPSMTDLFAFKDHKQWQCHSGIVHNCVLMCVCREESLKFLVDDEDRSDCSQLQFLLINQKA